MLPSHQCLVTLPILTPYASGYLANVNYISPSLFGVRVKPRYSPLSLTRDALGARSLVTPVVMRLQRLVSTGKLVSPTRHGVYCLRKDIGRGFEAGLPPNRSYKRHNCSQVLMIGKLAFSWYKMQTLDVPA